MPPKGSGKTYLLPNPTDPNNWPKTPKTQEEFANWLAATEAGLHEWIAQARQRVYTHDTAVKAKAAIAAHITKRNGEWAKHEPLFDRDTGEIYNRRERLAMEKAMNALVKEGEELHNSHHTWYRHVERMYAELSLEDFLYYQNVWNRKGFEPEKTYYETKMERDYREGLENKESDKKKAAKKRKGTEEPDPVVNNSGGDRPEKLARYVGQDRFYPIRRTPDGNHGHFGAVYIQWRNHMISLYTRFKLGYRKQMPEVVGYAEAHRYSQPPRGTTVQTLEPHRLRCDHLELRFPRMRRKEVDDDEVEEEYPDAARIAEDASLAATGNMELINWRLDDAGVKKRKHDLEGSDRYKSAERAEFTNALISTGHVPYHASTGTSFDWPTLFDSPSSGNRVAFTGNRLEYLYEKESNVRTLPKEQREARRDKNNDLVKEVDTTIRYKKIPLGPPRKAMVLEPTRDETGNVLGRDRDGKWHESLVEQIVQDETYEMAGRKRVRLQPRFRFRRTFRVRVRGMEELKGTRSEDHEVAGRAGELSDDEEDDCTSANPHYRLSGDHDPDNVGAGPEGEENDAAGSDLDVSDGDTDDDGDLFKQSYEDSSQFRPPH